ncbi:MAG: response regulator transcription factor [Saprospiraceae bacterium]|nr:response regulator transcription factor [Saprospiraceae bacterium]
MKKQVFIIDDHELFSRSLEMMINSFDDYTVVFCGQSGKDLIFRLQDSLKPAPDIILLDLNMPVMNGLETMDWISVNRPELNVLVLSMQDNDDLVLKMIRKGVKGYLLKDISPQILLKALDDTLNYGFFHSGKVTQALLNSLHCDKMSTVDLKDKELQFLKLACTEMTYKEIAEVMNLSPKTIDGYRDMLFEKLDVKSRVGLVLYALKHDLCSI